MTTTKEDRQGSANELSEEKTDPVHTNTLSHLFLGSKAVW
jgi:hypothetical protein